MDTVLEESYGLRASEFLLVSLGFLQLLKNFVEQKRSKYCNPLINKNIYIIRCYLYVRT